MKTNSFLFIKAEKDKIALDVPGLGKVLLPLDLHLSFLADFTQAVADAKKYIKKKREVQK